MENRNISLIVPQVNSESRQQGVRRDAQGKAFASRFRNFLSQFAAVLAINIIKFSVGFMNGLNTILLAEFYKENAEIKFTLEQLTWFGSYFFMGPVGSILSGLLAHLLGSRVAVLIGTFVHIVCGLIFYYGTSVELLLTAQALLGLFFSVSFVPGLAYMAEVSEPQFRSIFIVSGTLFVLIGTFFGVLLGSLMYWRTVILMNVAVCSIGFIAIYFIPNPPQWLASKGRLTEAVKSMAWLRGCAMPEQIKQDYSFLRDDRANESNISQIGATLGATENQSLLEKKKKRTKKNDASLWDKSFFLPLLTVCYLFVIRTFTGSQVIMTYSIIIFEIMNSPVEQHIASVVLNAGRLLSGVICIFIIRYTGVRKLLFSSLAVTGISILVAALCLFLTGRNTASDVYQWIALVMVLLASFSSSVGCDRVCYMLNVELFPAKFRSVGAGFGHFVNGIISGLLNKFFLYWLNVSSLQDVFLTFGLVTFFGLVTSYFIIPETQGKSMKEIEQMYANKKKYTKVEPE